MSVSTTNVASESVSGFLLLPLEDGGGCMDSAVLRYRISCLFGQEPCGLDVVEYCGLFNVQRC